MTDNVIFVGCGKVAIGAAQLLNQQGIKVHGVRRDVTSLPAYMQKTAADVCRPESLGFLKNANATTLVYSLAAGSFDEESYKSAYLGGLQSTINAAGSSKLKRLIFVSSTAVYHQNDSSIVDETSTTNPVRFNGRIMLEAEHTALATGIASCVRFSGIYGPGRNRLIERVRRGQCTAEDTNTFTNRIHTSDCSAALAHLITQPELPPVVLGSDSMPATSTEVESFIAQQLGVEKTFADSQGLVKRIAGSKRCCNHLLLDTGFEFTYPDYRAGYTSLIKDYKSAPLHDHNPP